MSGDFCLRLEVQTGGSEDDFEAGTQHENRT